MEHPSAPRPPALARKTPRSFHAYDPAAVAEALEALGARALPAAQNELARLAYAGGLALIYESGRVVTAGPAPQALGDLLDRWAAEWAAPPPAASSLFDMFGAEPGRKGAAS